MLDFKKLNKKVDKFIKKITKKDYLEWVKKDDKRASAIKTNQS